MGFIVLWRVIGLLGFLGICFVGLAGRMWVSIYALILIYDLGVPQRVLHCRW